MTEEEYLASYDITKYDRPSIATDIVIFSVIKKEEHNYRKDAKGHLSVLMIERGQHPFIGQYALPGGFMVSHETPSETATRELYEETGIKKQSLNSFGVFGDRNRDPRGWIVSHGYMALINAEDYRVRAGTDAWEANWFRISVDKKSTEKISAKAAQITEKYKLTLENDSTGEVLSANLVRERKIQKNYHEDDIYIEKSEGISFDHAKIILSAYLNLVDDVEKNGSIIFDFLPETFTLRELQDVAETILNRQLLVANFRRKYSNLVIEDDSYDSTVGHRPAKLFRRNLKEML